MSETIGKRSRLRSRTGRSRTEEDDKAFKHHLHVSAWEYSGTAAHPDERQRELHLMRLAFDAGRKVRRSEDAVSDDSAERERHECK